MNVAQNTDFQTCPNLLLMAYLKIFDSNFWIVITTSNFTSFMIMVPSIASLSSKAVKLTPMNVAQNTDFQTCPNLLLMAYLKIFDMVPSIAIFVLTYYLWLI